MHEIIPDDRVCLLKGRSKKNAALFFVSFFFLLYLALYLALDHLRFEVRKDELHFWPTSLSFSNTWVPTLQQLRSYNDLNTPLPFVVFGTLEHLFHQGIWLGRLLNLGLSFLCVLAIAFRGGASTRSFLCAIGLLLCPYYLGTSTHLYTDIIALTLSLAGVSFFFRQNYLLSSLAFVAAISSRQYSVVFPASLFLWSAYGSWTQRRLWLERRVWGSMALAAASLLGWFLFFGGPAPRDAMNAQFIATSSPLALLPHNALYSLACVGLYYVIPELVFFRSARERFRQQLSRQWAWGLVALTLVLFVVFPPLRNPPGYFMPDMGYFDKALRALLADDLRVVVFFFFAALTVIRFARWSLPAILVFANALLMMKAHVAWDKYALPLLAVLWWLNARSLPDYDSRSPE